MKKTLLGFVFGLSLALGLTAFAGENPWNVFVILIKSAFGSNYDFGLTLFYATPLIFCGLSVAWAFRAGMFNIGAEGQLTFASLVMAWGNFEPFDWAAIHKASAPRFHVARDVIYWRITALSVH